MTQNQIFISYSHKDEWLKEELISALGGLQFEGKAVVWHDRVILGGDDFEEEIDQALYSSSLFIMLVSSPFLASNYCMNIEFKEALKLRDQGTLDVLPVIVRQCDWQIEPIKGMRATPKDGIAVNPPNATRDQPELRDEAWTEVVKDVRALITRLEKKSNPLQLRAEYNQTRSENLQFLHGRKENVDLSELFVEPELVHSEDEIVTSLNEVFNFAVEGNTIVVTGDDQSGKTTLLYRIQELLLAKGTPAVYLRGEQIRNLNLDDYISKAFRNQIVTDRDLIKGEVCVLIDDLEDINLSERPLKKKVEELCQQYRSVIATSFAKLQSYFFIDMDISDPIALDIEQMPPNRIYELVEKWVKIGVATDANVDSSVQKTYQSLIGIARSGYIPCYPILVTNLLRVIDSSSGADVALTSNAACYDMVVSLQLKENDVPLNSIDRVKIALGYIAYEIFRTGKDDAIPTQVVNTVLTGFEKEFLVDMSKMIEQCKSAKIIVVKDGEFRFSNRFLLYFFIGKHLAERVRLEEPLEYKSVLDECIREIRRRDYANITLFCLYFSQDDMVLGSLCSRLDEQFANSKYWKINKSVDEQMAVDPEFVELTQSPSDARSERLAALSAKHSELIEDQKALAEQYVSPFSTVAVELEAGTYDDDDDGTYLGEMNNLFRLQTVIAAGLNTRAGTFGREVVVKAVDCMVKSAGRFVHTNLVFASQFKADPRKAIEELRAAFPKEAGEFGREGSARSIRKSNAHLGGIVERMLDYLTHWSIIVSQGVVGKCLAEHSTIMASKILHEEHERTQDGSLKSDKGYNYASAYTIARMWNSGLKEKDEFEAVIKEYGEDSHFKHVLRFALFVYSRYMPIEVGDRQWLDEKMGLPLDMTRMRQRRLTGK